MAGLVFLVGAHLAFLALVGVAFVYLLLEPRKLPQVAFSLLAIGVSVMPVVYGDSDYGGPSPTQFWYWALGLLVPAAAACFGLLLQGRSVVALRSLPRPILRPTVALVVVALLSLLYGLVRGGVQITDSVRQMSGMGMFLLFGALTFRMNLSRKESVRVFRTVESIAFVYCIVYLVRYVPAMLSSGDFEMERSPLLYFAGLFAAVSAARLLFNRPANCSRDAVRGAIFLLCSVLSGSRAVVLTLLFTVGLMFVYRHPSLSKKLAAAAAFGVLLLFCLSLGPLPAANSEGSVLNQISTRFVASPTADSSFLARVAEMDSIFQVVRQNPVLGLGMGARFVWVDPFQGEVETAFVDNGIGYLLLKMGLLGLCVFGWWSFTVLRGGFLIWKAERQYCGFAEVVCLVFYLSFLAFGPSFFQFSMSFWIGVVVGLIYSEIRRAWVAARTGETLLATV